MWASSDSSDNESLRGPPRSASPTTSASSGPTRSRRARRVQNWADLTDEDPDDAFVWTPQATSKQGPASDSWASFTDHSDSDFQDAASVSSGGAPFQAVTADLVEMECSDQERNSTPRQIGDAASQSAQPTAGQSHAPDKAAKLTAEEQDTFWQSTDTITKPPVKVAWSVGAELHESGTCHPCIFFTKAVGCDNGAACTFCHLEHDSKARHRRHMRWMGRSGRNKNAADSRDAAAVPPAPSIPDPGSDSSSLCGSNSGSHSSSSDVPQRYMPPFRRVGLQVDGGAAGNQVPGPQPVMGAPDHRVYRTPSISTSSPRSNSSSNEGGAARPIQARNGLPLILTSPKSDSTSPSMSFDSDTPCPAAKVAAAKARQPRRRRGPPRSSQQMQTQLAAGDSDGEAWPIDS